MSDVCSSGITSDWPCSCVVFLLLVEEVSAQQWSFPEPGRPGSPRSLGPGCRLLLGLLEWREWREAAGREHLHKMTDRLEEYLELQITLDTGRPELHRRECPVSPALYGELRLAPVARVEHGGFPRVPLAPDDSGRVHRGPRFLDILHLTGPRYRRRVNTVCDPSCHQSSVMLVNVPVFTCTQESRDEGTRSQPTGSAGSGVVRILLWLAGCFSKV